MYRFWLGRVALVLIILLAGLISSFPVQADQDEDMGSTWYLPVDKQPVCVGQKVVIRGGYTLTVASSTGAPEPLAPLVPDPLTSLVPEPPDPLAPLTSKSIVNESSIGTVSPKKINIYEGSGFFTFTFTATKPGTATIRSSIAGLPGPAQLTLRVTDRCHYIYGIRADFSIDITVDGGFAYGDYYIWAGGYLKVKDPNNPNFLSNDPQDRVTLGGNLTGFAASGCTAIGPLVPRTAPILGEGFVDADNPVVQVSFTKPAPFAASGAWSIVCPEHTVGVPDPYAGAMMMIDGAPSDQGFVNATCPADGGVCDATFPPLNFMSSLVNAGGASMPVSIEMKLEKVR